MSRYLIQRFLGGIGVMVGVTLLVFIILRLTGDPAALLLPPEGTKEDYAYLRQRLGLDKPLVTQFAIFVSGAARGDFGKSWFFNTSAREVVLERFPATLELGCATLAIIVLVGIPLGVISAMRPDSLPDQMLSIITLAGQAVPNFWLGIMLMLVFAVHLRLLPTSGRGGIANLIMPAVTLSTYSMSRLCRLSRSEMLEALAEDYVRTARAKGLPEWRVVLSHALRNVSLSLVTLIGFDIGYLIGGAIIVETVFAWPGIGRLMMDSITHRDFPVVQADVVFMSAIIVIINLVVDILYRCLDPRIGLQ